MLSNELLALLGTTGEIQLILDSLKSTQCLCDGIALTFAGISPISFGNKSLDPIVCLSRSKAKVEMPSFMGCVRVLEESCSTCRGHFTRPRLV